MLSKAQPWSPFGKFCPLSSLSMNTKQLLSHCCVSRSPGRDAITSKNPTATRKRSSSCMEGACWSLWSWMPPLGAAGPGEEGMSIPEPVPWVSHFQMCTRTAGIGMIRNASPRPCSLSACLAFCALSLPVSTLEISRNALPLLLFPGKMLVWLTASQKRRR